MKKTEKLIEDLFECKKFSDTQRKVEDVVGTMEYRINALQDALREAIEVIDGFGIDGEGLPRLRAILEDSEK